MKFLGGVFIHPTFFGASGTLAEASEAQVAEFIMVRGGVEEN